MVSTRSQKDFTKFMKNYNEVNISFDENRLIPNYTEKEKVLEHVLLPIDKIQITDKDVYLNLFNIKTSVNNKHKLGL
jgi:hypothetical protein